MTFYTRKSALEAQNELHNIKTMAGVSVTAVSLLPPAKLITVPSLTVLRVIGSNFRAISFFPLCFLIYNFHLLPANSIRNISKNSEMWR